MSFKAVLFDLDGTLLPMDLDEFTSAYFGTLAKKMAMFGYEPQAFVKAIMSGVKAMVTNDGKVTNEKAFWNRFCEINGEEAIKDQPIFEEYYKNEFQSVKSVCKPCAEAKKIVDGLNAQGIKVILATNPLFPKIATESRIRWAGLEPCDFFYFTTYENSCYCKPNPLYYKEILENLNLKPEECLMVGNDVSEDMVAEKLGIKGFLLTDWLINKDNADISAFEKGGFKELADYLGI